MDVTTEKSHYTDRVSFQSRDVMDLIVKPYISKTTTSRMVPPPCTLN